mmetsp:Transcript_38585/g.110375  ORF Transcript_38585/g.110375 Transcript_38585/m.110375 type:complete len:669 (+) Transcript_38585:148-2154(+)
MDFNQAKRDAASAKDEILRLKNQLLPQLVAQLDRVEQLDALTLATQALSDGALHLRQQLTLVPALIARATTDVTASHTALTDALDALQPPISSPHAAESSDGMSVELSADERDDSNDSSAEDGDDVGRPSFRITHRSGQGPPIEHSPARHRVSRECLAAVIGHYQPWQLTQLRPAIGTSIFHQSAAQHRRVTISCTDERERHLWGKIPLATAHKWGQRMTNLRELVVIYPESAPEWCRGAWVGLLKGHAEGRRALADRRARQGQGGEDEGTLEVLGFEGVELDRPLFFPLDEVSPDPLPRPSPSPPAVALPALMTVTILPPEYADVRVGRGWETPNVVRVTFDRDFFPTEQAAKEWCESEKLEKVDLADRPSALLQALPQSLGRLRSISGVYMTMDHNATPVGDAEVDALREGLVQRGCRRQLTSMPIRMPKMPATGEAKDLTVKTARLMDAVLDPEALIESPVHYTRVVDGATFDPHLLQWSNEHPSPTVRKIVKDLAEKAVIVVVSLATVADDQTIDIPDGTLPYATKIELEADSILPLEHRTKALQVAEKMSRLAEVTVGSDGAVPPLVAFDFLRGIWHQTWRQRGEQRELDVHVRTSSEDFVDRGAFGRLWGNMWPIMPRMSHTTVEIDGERQAIPLTCVHNLCVPWVQLDCQMSSLSASSMVG